MGKGRPMADAERFIKWHQVGRRSEKINFAPCFSSEPAIQAPVWTTVPERSFDKRDCATGVKRSSPFKATLSSSRLHSRDQRECHELLTRFLVRLSHPLFHAGLSRRILDLPVRPGTAPTLESFC